MKAVFSIFVIIGFVALAVFGFTAMGMNSGHNPHSLCIATIAKGFECPAGINLADFHISALKVFSSAVFSSYILLALLAVMGFGNFMACMNPRPAKILKARERNFYLNLFDQNFTKWISLHENSPALA